MKHKTGFVQIPIIIALIAGVFILGGTYLGVKKYKDYQVKNIEKKEEVELIAKSQQEALKEAQLEIEKLKEQSSESQKKQNNLEKKIVLQGKTTSSNNYTISAQDLAPYLTGVVEILCPVDKTAQMVTTANSSRGSGILWKNETVLTNRHVIEDAVSACNVSAYTVDGYVEGSFAIDPIKGYGVWNSLTDVAVLSGIDYQFEKIKAQWIKSIDKLNYTISNLRKCPSKMAVGSPVSMVGYPSYGKVTLNTEGDIKTSRIVTDGVVSGYDTSVTTPFGELPNPNYFVSAKIDSGNSGGVSFSKDKDGLCILGIPTWLNVGNYETQGLIQDINNVLYKKCSGFLDCLSLPINSMNQD